MFKWKIKWSGVRGKLSTLSYGHLRIDTPYVADFLIMIASPVCHLRIISLQMNACQEIEVPRNTNDNPKASKLSLIPR